MTHETPCRPQSPEYLAAMAWWDRLRATRPDVAALLSKAGLRSCALIAEFHRVSSEAEASSLPGAVRRRVLWKHEFGHARTVGDDGQAVTDFGALQSDARRRA